MSISTTMTTVKCISICCILCAFLFEKCIIGISATPSNHLPIGYFWYSETKAGASPVVNSQKYSWVVQAKAQTLATAASGAGDQILFMSASVKTTAVCAVSLTDVVKSAGSEAAGQITFKSPFDVVQTAAFAADAFYSDYITEDKVTSGAPNCDKGIYCKNGEMDATKDTHCFFSPFNIPDQTFTGCKDKVTGISFGKVWPKLNPGEQQTTPDSNLDTDNLFDVSCNTGKLELVAKTTGDVTGPWQTKAEGKCKKGEYYNGTTHELIYADADVLPGESGTLTFTATNATLTARCAKKKASDTMQASLTAESGLCAWANQFTPKNDIKAKSDVITMTFDDSKDCDVGDYECPGKMAGETVVPVNLKHKLKDGVFITDIAPTALQKYFKGVTGYANGAMITAVASNEAPFKAGACEIKDILTFTTNPTSIKHIEVECKTKELMVRWTDKEQNMNNDDPSWDGAALYYTGNLCKYKGKGGGAGSSSNNYCQDYWWVFVIVAVLVVGGLVVLVVLSGGGGEESDGDSDSDDQKGEEDTKAGGEGEAPTES